MKMRKVVIVDKPVDKVFDYLSDFTTSTEWDPGTVKTVRISGNGGVGTRYLNTSTFVGRRTELTYIVQELVPNLRIALRGENKTVVAHDTMTFRSVRGGEPRERTHRGDVHCRLCVQGRCEDRCTPS